MTSEHPASRAAIDTLTALATKEPTIASILEPREDALVRAADSTVEDDATRGRIVSEGWREAKEKRFDGLGARLPDAADGAMDVGSARFSDLHVRVSLDGARGVSTAHIHAGRVVYPDALESTDRVIASDRSTLEEFLVLRDRRAPRTFTWHVQLPAGISQITERAGGGYLLVDGRGRPKLAMSPPAAYDANGARLAVRTRWDEASQSLSVALGAETALAYPVVVDPKYETSAWFDIASRNPSERRNAAMAFDATRGEIVMFGGFDGEKTLADTWTWSGVTWTRRFPESSPAPRSHHALAFDSARGEIVLFGGLDYTDPNAQLGRRDTWVWDGATWTERATPTAPPSRRSHALAFSHADNEVLLFGGLDGSIPGNQIAALGDTWAWNGAAWTQRTTPTAPRARQYPALAADGARGEIVLFGGRDATGSRLSDTWVWRAGAWTLRSPATAPPARERHALAFNTASNEILLFGGTTNGLESGFLGDTWAWGGATWTRRVPTASPTPREGSAAAFDPVRKDLVLFGGRTTHGTQVPMKDTWRYDATSREWSEPFPSARLGHRLTFDAHRNEVLLFGGTTGATQLNDTWTWNGSVWTQLFPSLSPPARQNHALAYDSAHRAAVLFGGVRLGVIGDTWLWESETLRWVQQAPANPPSARRSHAMAFDASRSQVVLFGGEGDAGTLNDTWTWSSASKAWTLQSPVLRPSARALASMAFDKALGQVVLFGGTISTGLTFLNDTWHWNGQTWRQPTLVSTPSGRAGTSLAFDPVSGELILFGGYNASQSFADTWGYAAKTSTWTQRSTSAQPAARVSHAATFDTARGELVLFGGFVGALYAADTWVHRTLGGTCATNADCGDLSFCTDGVCCNAASCGTCETCAGTSPGRCTPLLNIEDRDTCAEKDGKSCSGLGECKASLGRVAASMTDCASGFLVDGVCCATDTCGPCETCNSALKERTEFSGRCSDAKRETDPHEDCAGEEPATCGRTGACDGNGRCALHPEGTTCGVLSVCSGVGTCINREAQCVDDHTAKRADGADINCSPYVCEGAVCKTVCASNHDCAGAAECNRDGRCVPFSVNPALETGGCSMFRGERAPSAAALLFALLFAGGRRSQRRSGDLPPRRLVLGRAQQR